jgi:hypothetical protein
MNGAGEIYLGYRFRHLEVFDYTSKNQDNILVELYFMETSDDAYGLLSLDWGGEPLSLNGSTPSTSNQALSFPASALYGAGLLRIWSDNVYARVMAHRETPVSKQAVFNLGRAILSNRRRSPVPELEKVLSLQIDTIWKLQKRRLSFFRSYLVLNSIYYISQENILDLNLSTEAVIVSYERISGSSPRKRCQFLLVKYESRQRAGRALNHFHDVYLPEYKKELTADSVTKSPSFFNLEDGWLAYKLISSYIAVVFESPDRESARIIIQKNESNLLKKEGNHER